MMSAWASLASSGSIASLPSPRISERGSTVATLESWELMGDSCESPRDITLDTTESRNASPTMVLRLERAAVRLQRLEIAAGAVPGRRRHLVGDAVVQGDQLEFVGPVHHAQHFHAQLPPVRGSRRGRSRAWRPSAPSPARRRR